MTDRKELEDYCTIFYEITSCPISLYNGEDCVFFIPQSPFSFAQHHYDTLFRQDGVSYVISDTALFYARVPVEKTTMSLVIGPFLMNFISDDYIRQVISEYGIISYPPEIVRDYLRSIASGVFSRAVTLVRFVCFTLTRRLFSITDLFSKTPEDMFSRISQKHTEALVQGREEETYHNTYNYERMIFSKVREGDVEFFQKALRSDVYRAGKIADTSLRQEKNMFIVSVTLATRAALAGGLDEETAFQLSDEYIQTVESMIALDSIDHLGKTMIMDFTERVREASLPLNDIPEDIRSSIKYIRLHTNSNLSVQEVADAVHLSRSHLSRKFKEVMGFEISAFMMRCKLEEARSLLMYSGQSISEISNYLCFSSQSYFTSIFRKKYGVTPKEYRQQSSKKIIP